MATILVAEERAFGARIQNVASVTLFRSIVTLRGCSKPPEGVTAVTAVAANLIHVHFLGTTQCSFETEPFTSVTSLHTQNKTPTDVAKDSAIRGIRDDLYLLCPVAPGHCVQ